MPRVYITQSPMRRNVNKQLVHKFDLAPAREFGHLEILLPSGPVLISNTVAVAQLWERLQNFTAEDHLLCLGDPVAIAAAAAIVAQVNDGCIPLLVYDRHIEKYLAIKVDTNPARLQKVAA